MTKITDEKKAELDATAAERAAVLEEEEHHIAGLGQKHLLDGPQPYHAGQLTPAYHVPGNVVTEPSAADLDAVAAEESAQEATQGEPADPTTSNQSESAPIAESDTASPDASAPTEEQEQTSGNA